MRYLLYTSPEGKVYPSIGNRLRSEATDKKYGVCITTGLFLIRFILVGGVLGPIKKVYQSRVRPMSKGHQARELDLSLDEGIEGDPHERAWRKL